MKAVSGKANSSLLAGNPWSSKSLNNISGLSEACSLVTGMMNTLGKYLCIECRQIWPWMMVHLLLVSFSLSNVMEPCDVHISPNAGESPWKKSPDEGSGSPAPATIHFELRWHHLIKVLLFWIVRKKGRTCGRRSGTFYRRKVRFGGRARRTALARGPKLALWESETSFCNVNSP